MKLICCSSVSATNNGAMPVSRYFEADVNLLGFQVPRVGFLVVKDPNTLLEPQCTTQLPGAIGCNLIHLGYENLVSCMGSNVLRKIRISADVISSGISSKDKKKRPS